MNDKNATIDLFKTLSVREQIRTLKTLTGAKLQDFALATGLSMNHISGYLNESKVLKVTAIEEIAESMGYKVVLVPISESENK